MKKIQSDFRTVSNTGKKNEPGLEATIGVVKC